MPKNDVSYFPSGEKKRKKKQQTKKQTERLTENRYVLGVRPGQTLAHQKNTSLFMDELT